MVTINSNGVNSVVKEIRELKRSKQIEGKFSRVSELLKDVQTTEEIAQVGQILKNLDYSEIIIRYPEVKKVNIALTGNFVLNPIQPFLKYFHLRDNILPNTYIADYGQYVYEILDINSALYEHQPEITVCLLDEHLIFEELVVPWRLSDIERILQDKLQHIEKLVTQYVKTSSGLLILNTIPLSLNRSNQLLDYKSKASLSSLWKEFNASLLKLSNQFKSLIVIDIEPLLANATGLSDDRLSQYAKIYMTESLLSNYAFEISKISRAIKGKTRKCLVLDLDNTLWKGILGDDGTEGIEVSDTLVGEAFHHFQLVIKQLADQGIVLATNSKNDIEKVKDVFQNHPKMVLREDDFVNICANWSPKHENIKEIAQTLNLGLDSFVFVDDSEFERNLVRSKQPSVIALELEEDPATYAKTLLTGGWFNTLEITKEDYSRTQKYKTEVQRQEFLSKFDSIDDYLHELELKVNLFAPQQADIVRISQLTLRTNQFNMTTKRYQEAEINQLLDDSSIRIIGIESQDRFGDNGIVGCVFTRQPIDNKSELYIDNFLLSCRVFSRGIETISLEHILQQAQAANIEKVYAEYIPSSKNQKVHDFYKKHGFELVEETPQRVLYVRSLTDNIALSVKHINLSSNYRSFNRE
ncbi:MAG: HAD-IIIC family phosphatase [Nostoc sp. ChiSLP01]|nr:HAD-IIIC family phosphatase [Nostoc sp. CmiSLP01]MDZ8286541.1 HAD-IIIC family phosphatase [Nostoc sp. ChiSLP01]